MVERATVVSLLILVVIVVVAALMYVVIGNQGGWVGVPRVLSPEDPNYNILNGVLITVMFILLGVSVYYLRRLKD
jgi:ABC-type uncharacterized transport system permease subunit